MWIISKEFDLCFGHRVWSQKLNKNLSLNDKCKCRHLHGHQGKITINVKSNELSNGMVTDFNHFNWFKQFIDEELDHKFIIDKGDPLIDILVPCSKHFSNDIIPWIQRPAGHYIVNPDYFKTIAEDHIIELLESYVRVDFLPTSENICVWLYEHIYNIMGDIVDSVEFMETSKTKSVFKK